MRSMQQNIFFRFKYAGYISSPALGTSGNAHHNDVKMRAMVSQITSMSIVYSAVCSGAKQRKHQSSASLAFVEGIHRWPVNSPHKGPITRKNVPFGDVIMHRGGNASGFLFRCYLALLEYLDTAFGICCENKVICPRNRMIVDNIKTIAMKFGRKSEFTLLCHGQNIDKVNNKKYIGNILSSAGRSGSDMLRESEWEGQEYWFHIRKRSIITYGRDVWRISKSANVSANRIFLNCAKSALGVKYNTSCVMGYGEIGTFPPSVIYYINVVCFYNRLRNMCSNRLAMTVPNELEYFHHNDFCTWVTDVLDPSQTYGVENFEMDCNSFKHTARNWYEKNYRILEIWS